MPADYSFNQKKLNRPSENTLVVKRAGSDRLQNDIANLIISRDATITKEEAISLLENYASTIEMLLKTDNSMHTPLYNPLSRISRSFNDNSFPDLRKKTAAVSHEPEERSNCHTSFTQSNPELHKPVLNRCHNVVSNSSIVMSGSVVQVYGNHLNFDKTDSKQGVFMTDLQGSTIKATTLVRLKADNIIFMVPGGLAAGDYKLEVRSKCRNSGKMFSGLLPGTLTVII